ncbi:MAG: hypothetical protein A2Z34_06555 [Planctomycetes bacterium RBG_16_59_8]|nr:MAG: hypothetical protein A2Z34_06555 [Planctomycetes bacterium RBG_16_59_8]
MARRKPEESKIDDLPLTAMIDVVFQLIIFFLLMPLNKSLEGKLFSQLPKDKGLASAAVSQPELKEIRIRLRYDPPSQITQVSIERQPVGDLSRSVVYSGVGGHRKTQTGQNKQTYERLSSMAADFYKKIPSSRDSAKAAPVIMDASEDTPWEHVVGVVNACRAVGIDNVEFTGNPKFKDLR